MAATAAATAVAADARPQVTAVADVLLPAIAEVEAIRRRAVVELRTVAADHRTAAAVAADMGGNSALDSFPA
jgi:hypothetical protein